MLQEEATIETRYKEFIEKSATSKLVWGLKNKNGWANSHAQNSEDITVIPFWSDKAYAKASARDEWKSYLPALIPLAEFLESWCVEMGEEGVLLGVNWDAHMHGKESDALQVALDILIQLNTTASAISFANYSSINEFITAIKENVD